MPTPPFDSAIENALKGEYQSGELKALKQWVDTPDFFCCISGNTVGVAKDPVCILAVDRVVCIGEAVELDFSRCWSPTDYLEGTAYTIHWGDGDVTNGNFPNPRNAAAEVETKALGYDAVGFYDIEMDIEDTLGASRTCRIQIYVADCVPAWYRVPWVRTGAMIAGDLGDMYWTENFEDALPNWTSLSGGPLSQQCWDAKLKQEGGAYTLYVATTAGVYTHPIPPDTGTWTALTTALEMAEEAEPAKDFSGYYLKCRKLACHFEEDGYQWCLWEANPGPAPAVGDAYVGVAHTRDNWETIEYSETVYSLAEDFWYYNLTLGDGLAVWQHSQGLYVYAVVNVQHDRLTGTPENFDTRLFQSSDRGQSFSQIDIVDHGYANPGRGAVYVPYTDMATDHYIYWTAENTSQNMVLRRSINGGLSFSELKEYTTAGSNAKDITGTVGRVDSINIGVDNELWEYTDVDGSAQVTPNPATGDYFENIMATERGIAGNGSKFVYLFGVGYGNMIDLWERNTSRTGKGGYWPAGPNNTVIAKPELGEYQVFP